MVQWSSEKLSDLPKMTWFLSGRAGWYLHVLMWKTLSSDLDATVLERVHQGFVFVLNLPWMCLLLHNCCFLRSTKWLVALILPQHLGFGTSFTKRRRKSPAISGFTGEMIPQEPLLPSHFPVSFTLGCQLESSRAEKAKRFEIRGHGERLKQPGRDPAERKWLLFFPLKLLFVVQSGWKQQGLNCSQGTKGFFWLREAIVVRMDQNRREVFYVKAGPTKCQNWRLQAVIEFCEHLLSTCFVPGALTWLGDSPIPQWTCKVVQDSFLLFTHSFNPSLLWPNNIVAKNIATEIRETGLVTHSRIVWCVLSVQQSTKGTKVDKYISSVLISWSLGEKDTRNNKHNK